MKKAIILSIMVMFGGVAFAQTLPNTNVVTFEKVNTDVGVVITKNAKGEIVCAVAVTKKSLEAKLAQKQAVDSEAAVALQRLEILK